MQISNNKKKSLFEKRTELFDPVIAFFSKWGFIFFVAAWMFFLGVIVGRHTTPVYFKSKDIHAELAEKRKAEIEKKQEQIKADLDSLNKKDALDFHEELKKDTVDYDPPKFVVANRRKNGVNGNTTNRNGNGNGGMLPEKTPLTKKHKNTVEVKEPPEKETNQIEKPVENEPDMETVLAKERKDARKRFTIQLASFKDREVADKQVDKLRKKGYQAYRAIGIIPGNGVWHRVRIGYYADKEDARSTIDRLKKDNFKAILINRD